MNIVWVGRRSRSDDLELHIDGVNMGWVDDLLDVHCMWMTYGAATDERGHLIESQYPEDHKFNTLKEAKAALLESAVPVYIGGFRGR